MLLLITKQVTESKALLVTLSATAIDGVNPKSINAIVCSTDHISHHTAKATLNLISDKDDVDDNGLI